MPPLQRSRIPKLDESKGTTVVRPDAAISHPSGVLIEATRGGIAVKDPEGRPAKTRRTEAGHGDVHEQAAASTVPTLRSEVDRGELAGAMQPGQGVAVPPISLDPITALLRHARGIHDDAGFPLGREIQREAGR